MRSKQKFPMLFLTVLMIFSACGEEGGESGSSKDTLLTAAVGTMVSGFFGTQTAMVTPTLPSTDTPPPANTSYPTTTPSPIVIPATWTPTYVYFTAMPGGSVTPSVTGTLSTATVDPFALGSGCNNLAFIRDVNYPSGTAVTAGETFTKTWKVQNIGTCDWLYGYALTTVGEDHFRSTWSQIGRIVKPWDWTELSVVAEAPKKEGTYTTYYRLTDGGGTAFGTTLGLTIVVTK